MIPDVVSDVRDDPGGHLRGLARTPRPARSSTSG